MSDILLDVNLNLLTELINIIDQQLDNTIRQSRGVDDPDGFGYFDSAEQITGLGFVVCQTYVATVCGRLLVEKEKALTVGPQHPSGQTKVQIVNHAANYWKHNGEWPLDRSPKRRMIIEAAFESIGFPVNTEYPLSGVLTEVASPESAGFKPVIAALELWKNELSKAT
jgi:hypothetical protein